VVSVIHSCHSPRGRFEMIGQLNLGGFRLAMCATRLAAAQLVPALDRRVSALSLRYPTYNWVLASNSL
jgi:hypothetical protein